MARIAPISILSLVQFLSLGMNGFDFENSGLEEKLKTVKKKASTLSLLRLIVFFAMGALFVLSISESPYLFFGFLAAAYAFISLIRKYNVQKD
ncbi:MAG: hypothetical protein ABJH96_19125, partial [Algoriphagus sp.]